MNVTTNSCLSQHFENEEMRPRNGLLYPVLAGYYYYHLISLTMKHWHHIENVHRFELNTMLDWCFSMTSQALQQFEHHAACPHDLAMLCVANQFLMKWSMLCLFADIVLCQVDRFLALYWNAEYNERLDDDKAKRVILVTKLIIAILTLGCVLLDPGSFSCTPNIRFACAFFVWKALFYRSIPMFISLLTIFAVSLYVWSVMLKHQRMVAPVVNNLNVPPPPDIPSVSAAVEQDIVVEDIVVEDIEEGDEEREEVVVKRTDNNPHLFFRVTKEKVLKTKCFPVSPSKALFEKTKLILKSSLMTLCLTLTMVPQNLVVVYVFVKQSNCFNDPMLITYGNTSGFIALINLICYPLLVRRKLRQSTL